MAWDDLPPSKAEMGPKWTADPPSKEDLAASAWDAKPPSQADLNPHSFDLKAAAYGDAQYLSAGHLPQVQAGFAKALDNKEKYPLPGPLAALRLASHLNPSDQATRDLESQKFNVQEIPKTYVGMRDQAVKDVSQTAEENPYSYLAGAGVAAVASSKGVESLLSKAGVPLDSTVTKAPGLIKSTIQGGLGGAVMGGAQNPGDEPGVVHNPLEGDFQTEGRAEGAGKGFLTGAVANAASRLISGSANTLAKGPEAIQNTAEKWAKKLGAFHAEAKTAGALIASEALYGYKKDGIEGAIEGAKDGMIHSVFLTPAMKILSKYGPGLIRSGMGGVGRAMAPVADLPEKALSKLPSVSAPAKGAITTGLLNRSQKK